MLNHRQGAPPQQRRVFRGKGGPTDGRLPPKKKKSVAIRHDGSKYKDDASSATLNNAVPAHDRVPFPQTDPFLEEGSNADVSEALEVTTQPPPSEEEEAFEAEVKHLKKRIVNHRLSMSQSSAYSLENYSANVLKAAMKIIREWDSIYRYHHATSESAVAIVDQIGTLVFELIQQCLQTGPLSGAKPGYLKRCGSEVAQAVSSFLGALEDIPGLSEAQCTTLQIWKANAEKASVVQKPPSKSMLKKIKKKVR